MPVINYIWDEVNDTLLMEKDEDGNTMASYTYEPGRYGPLISQHRGGQSSYYQFDGQGSTRQLTDAGDAVTDTCAYTAFGETVAQSGTTTNPFGYRAALGYYLNPETNDFCAPGGVLVPSVGRWLAPDNAGVSPIALQFVVGAVAGIAKHSASLSSYGPKLRRRKVPPPPSWPEVLVTPLYNNFSRVKCGSRAFANWSFSLTSPAPCEGYIVQRVEYFCRIDPSCTRCPSWSGTRPSADVIYFEAFPVDKNQSLSIPEIRDGYGDEASRTITDKMCGNVVQFGVAKFFCKRPADSPIEIGTGPLGGLGQDPADTDIPTDPRQLWGIRKTYSHGLCSVRALELPSTGGPPGTSSEPFWWSTGRSTPSSSMRSFAALWDCCHCRTNINRVYGVNFVQLFAWPHT